MADNSGFSFQVSANALGPTGCVQYNYAGGDHRVFFNTIGGGACSGTNMCLCGWTSPPPPEPPHAPPPSSPPSSPPSFPPIQPIVVKSDSACQNHLTRIECELRAAHDGYVMQSLGSNPSAQPGCYKYVNIFGSITWYYNDDLGTGRSCVESGFTCYCGVDGPSCGLLARTYATFFCSIEHTSHSMLTFSPCLSGIRLSF